MRKSATSFSTTQSPKVVPNSSFLLPPHHLLYILAVRQDNSSRWPLLGLCTCHLHQPVVLQFYSISNHLCISLIVLRDTPNNLSSQSAPRIPSVHRFSWTRHEHFVWSWYSVLGFTMGEDPYFVKWTDGALFPTVGSLEDAPLFYKKCLIKGKMGCIYMALSESFTPQVSSHQFPHASIHGE